MTATRAMIYGSALVGDPSFSLVQALVHFDGANGSQSWVDDSSHHHSFAAANASLTLSTAQFLFGTASFLSPANGFILSLSASADYKAGLSDFCIEVAFRTGTPSQGANLIDFRTTANQTAPVIYIGTSQLHYFTNNADKIAGGTILTNTWQRACYSRIGTTGRLLLDGTSLGTWVDSSNYNAVNYPIAFCGAFNGAGTFAGNMDEFRYTVGDGRRSGSYTLDTAAFPNF